MPRAGDPYLNGDLPAGNNPLNRIDFQPFTSTFSLEAFFEQLKQFLDDYVFPAIKDLIGLDFSSPDEFVLSLINLITTGGPVLQFAAGILDILGSFVGIPNLGEFLKGLVQLVGGGAVAGIGGILQQILSALVGGLTGGQVTGTDPASIALALLNLPLQIGSQIFDTIFGTLASFQALLTGQQNNPGVTIGDDFATNILSGRRTNVLGTMAISTRGKYLQTPNLAADYMGTTGAPRKPATVKCGSSITIGAVMNGTARTYIHSDVSMSNYAALEVFSGFDGDCLRIVSGSAPDLVVMQAQFDLGSAKVQAGNTFDIRFDPATNRYMVWRNNQDTGLFWADTTNIVTRSTSKLFTGAVTNGDDRNEDGFYGPGISKETFYDW